MQQHLKADILLVVVTFLAAAGWIFSKEALTGLPPLLFIGTRFLLAGVIPAVAGKNQWALLTRQGLKSSLSVGSCFAVAIMLWVTGLHNTQHLGEAAFITSLGIVLVPFIALIAFKEPQPTSIWIALPVAIFGLFLLAFKSSEHTLNIESGQLFFLVAAITFAVQYTLNNRAVKVVPAIILTSIQLLVVGFSAITLSYFTESWPSSITSEVTGWFLASAIIATSLRFFIQTYAQKFTPASHGAMILTLEPILTACLASLWFGESMTFIQLIGCGFIFSALIINRWQLIPLPNKR